MKQDWNTQTSFSMSVMSLCRSDFVWKHIFTVSHSSFVVGGFISSFTGTFSCWGNGRSSSVSLVCCRFVALLCVNRALRSSKFDATQERWCALSSLISLLFFTAITHKVVIRFFFIFSFFFNDSDNNDNNSNNNNNNVKFNSINTTTDSHKLKEKITGQTSYNDTKNVELIIPLKYLTNFLGTLKMYFTNFEINLILTWSANCIIKFSAVDQSTIFAICDAKLYIPL